MLTSLADQQKLKTRNYEQLLAKLHSVSLAGAGVEKALKPEKVEPAPIQPDEYVTVTDEIETTPVRAADTHIRMQVKQMDQLLNEAAELVINNNQFKTQIEVNMGMSVEAAQAVSSGISGTSTIVAGILNYMATTQTNKENLGLAEKVRQDTLAAQREANKLARKQQALNERQQKFTEQEAGLNRAERAEERGYGRAMGSYKRAADLLGQNYDLLARKTAPFMKRG